MLTKQDLHKRARKLALKEYWQQYAKYPWLTLGSFLLPGVGSIFVFFVPPLIIARIVNTYAANGALSLDTMVENILLFGGLWLFGEVCWRAGMYVLTQLEAHGMRNLAERSFEYLQERDYDFYTDNFVGSLTKRAQAFAKSFEGFTDLFSFSITPNILPMLFAMVVLARYSPWISVLLVAALIVVIVCVRPFIKIRSKLVALRHEASSKMTGVLSDTLTNIMAVKSFATEREESARFAATARDFTDKFKAAADYHTFRIDLILSPLYVLTNMAGLAAAIFFGSKFHLPPGTLLVVFSYYATVTRSFWQVNHVYRTIESTLGEATEFAELVIDKPAIEDIPGASNLAVERGGVFFDSVTFAYAGATGDPFLEDFSLSIPANQKVGLVGPSGGGKTTITKLLMRFADVQAGQVTIDGQNISKVTQQSLRKAIAYVPQDPLLFHRSLFENIAYGTEGATLEDVVRIAKLAHADEFIAKLPLGYDTLVGERGIKLSGGQRQRIAIARAMLRQASILVLDEATSALDSESEKYIQESLWELMKDKTAIVIAHRLSTIRHLDRIIVLDNGRIAQDGSHEELITQKGGLYAKLWSHQSGGFIEE